MGRTHIDFTQVEGSSPPPVLRVNVRVEDQNNQPLPTKESIVIAPTAPWLTLSPRTGTTPFDSDVGVVMNTLGPGSYTASFNETSSNPNIGSALPTVTLVVTPKPAPPPIGDQTPPVVTMQPVRWTGKKTTLVGTALDAVGVAYMELLIDGELRVSAAGNQISALWNTASLKIKTHIVEIKAYDLAGNVGSLQRTVTIP